MKKFILGTALLTSAFTTMLMAQSKLLAKTTWKIENIAANGNIVLKKQSILISLLRNQNLITCNLQIAKKYKTGNSCFQTDANYNLYEESNKLNFIQVFQVLHLIVKKPKNIEGTYVYKITGDRMDLERIQSENMNNEDSQAAEGAEIAGQEKLLMLHRKRQLPLQKPAKKEANKPKKQKTTKKVRK